MGVASLVLGIVSIVFCWIPCVGNLCCIPALIGIILGACGIGVAKKHNGEGKGVAIAGFVLSIIAFIFSIFWILVFGAAAASAASGL